MRTFKFFVLLLVCQFVSSEAMAQRIKQERVTLAYNRLPNAPLPADFTTYSVTVNPVGKALTTANLTQKGLIDNYLKLRAFKKLPKGGHFHINVAVNRLKIISSEDKTETYTTKDKEGNEKKSTGYYRNVLYKVPVTFTMEDKNGNILEQEVFGSSAEGLQYRFTRSKQNTFNSRADLNKAWSNRTPTFNTLQKEVIQKAFSTFSKKIKRKYDITKESIGLPFLVPAGKKVAAADEFRATAVAAANIIKSIKPQVAIDGAKKDLQPMIDFWTTQKDNFSADQKKEVKVHHACLFNLALAYLITENLQEARTYIDLAAATKKNKSLTNQLNAFIIEQDKMMKQHEVTTLFFPIDLATAVAPAGISYKKYEPKEPAKPVDRSVKYDGQYITTGGETLNGTYVFRTGQSANPKFYQEGNVKFIYNNEKGEKELTLTASSFRGGTFNGRTFKIMKRNPEMSIKKALFAVETIEEGPKMVLLRAYPLEKKKDGSTINNQTLLKVKGQDKYHSVSNTSNPNFLNWKKSFAKLFEGCEVLYAEIRVGEFDRDLESIAEAVRLYNQNSCN